MTSEQGGHGIEKPGSHGHENRQYCRKERLKLSSLQRWQARLKDLGVRQDFVTVVPPSASATPSRAWTVEVTLPDGTRLRFQG